jgi:carbon monoxide dehydrogenase subunit G
LMDQQTLQHVIPGAERLEALGEDTYDIAMHIGSSPLAGFYHGHVTVTERQYPSSYHLTLECEGSQRTINGEGSVYLNEHGENTVVAYKGTLHLSKLATPLPIPVIKGVAKMLIQQFFTSLADGLSVTAHTPTVTARGKIVLLPALPKPTLQTTIVRWLGLGTDGPAARTQWASLLKLAVIALGLLLLVWIASRISRR